MRKMTPKMLKLKNIDGKNNVGIISVGRTSSWIVNEAKLAMWTTWTKIVQNQIFSTELVRFFIRQIEAPSQNRDGFYSTLAVSNDFDATKYRGLVIPWVLA